MARTKKLQTNFSAGELAPELGMREDTDQHQNGARSLHNRRCLIGGGTVRRPGSWRDINLPNRARLVRWIVNRTTQYVVAFGEGRADFYARNVTTGQLTAAGSLASCPWTGTIWREMGVVQAANTMFLTHTDMVGPRIITRTGAAAWALSTFAFRIGPASRPEQPYLKFADATRTLAASDVTGSITLTISGATAYFVAAHVGTYIRYHRATCLITAVAADGLSCTATVIETLPETYRVTVFTSAEYSIGDIVEGATTGAKGIITGIPNGTNIDVVLLEKLIAFEGTEKIVGPRASRAMSAIALTTNAAVVDWDEQMFSPIYGYPSCIELHRNRLLMAGHLNAPDFLIGSALGDLYNFNVGDGSDADAILESIGDAEASRIVQLYSAEQLIVATDNGFYYVPESAQAPFRPTSIAFYPFGSPWPISPTVRMAAFDGGVLAVSGSLVIKARPTGDQGGAWNADEVSLLSNHLFKAPVGMTVVTGFSAEPERYAALCNVDGTLGILQLVEAQKIRNVTPWETDRPADTFESVVGIEGDLYAACIRAIAGNTIYTLERFDQDITLDCAVQLTDLADVPTHFGNTPVNVVTENGLHLGTYPLSLDETPPGPYIVGFFYESEIGLFPPTIESQKGSHSGDEMRIVEAYVHVISSARFAANGYELTAYQATDDMGEPPPVKEGAQRFQFLGWQREPTLSITQTDPLPLKVLAISQLVAY